MKDRIYELPIIVSHINRKYDNQEYLLDKIEKFDDVKSWYESKGIKVLGTRHITPAIGPERDEIEAKYPEGWEEVAAGGPWVDIINEHGEKIISLFVKKAPWDYCFFAK